MKLKLTENQYQKIILESSSNKITNYLEEMKEFVVSTIKQTEEDLKINLGTLMIWGTGVAGFMGPLKSYMSTGNFEINEYQISSIICAVTCILLGESSRDLKKLIDYIEKEGLKETFLKVLKKGQKLKRVFVSFIESLNVVTYKLSNILSYTFIIPILPMLWSISQSEYDENTIKEIVTRLTAFGIIGLTSNALRILIIKLLERFKD